VTSGGGERPLVAVLDYGIGNLRSAQKALERQGADARLTADPGLVGEAAGVVLPGVGAFGRCMEALERSGLVPLAHDAARSGRPFLGICIGLQMLYEASEETPGRPGLGLVPGVVRRLPEGVKRPQMQWNLVHRRPDHPEHPLFDGLDDPCWMYFVHSFAPEDPVHAIATCDYGGEVTVAIARDNVVGTQFHPEKSGANGLALLGNFVRVCAAARV
jgi:glutamine amidotransferase